MPVCHSQACAWLTCTKTGLWSLLGPTLNPGKAHAQHQTCKLQGQPWLGCDASSIREGSERRHDHTGVKALHTPAKHPHWDSPCTQTRSRGRC